MTPPPDARESADARGPADGPGGDERVGWDRFAASLVGRWAAFATRAPCASVERVGEAHAAIFPASPTREIFNNAWLPPGAADPAATLIALRRAYARAGVARFALWLRADDRPAVAACAAAGWRTAGTTLAMHAVPSVAAVAGPATASAPGAVARPGAAVEPGAITVPGAAPAPGSDVALAEVTETAEICVLNEVDADLLQAWPAGARAYLVRDTAGRALSSAVAIRHGDDCAIGFVATVPAARRQGHAGRILTRLLADAAADGCTTATLAATAASERLYRTLGFRDLGRVVMLQPLL